MHKMAEVIAEIERFEDNMRYFKAPFYCIGPISTRHLPQLVITIRYNVGGKVHVVQRAITPRAFERMAFLIGKIIPGTFEAIQGIARVLAQAATHEAVQKAEHAVAENKVPLSLLRSYCESLNLYIELAQKQLRKQGKYPEYCILSVPSNRESGKDERVIIAFLSGAYSPIFLKPILRRLEQRMAEQQVSPEVLEYAISYELTVVVLPIEYTGTGGDPERKFCLQIVNGYTGTRSFAVIPSLYWNSACFAFESAVPRRVYHVHNVRERVATIMSYMSSDILGGLDQRWNIARTRTVGNVHEVVEALRRQGVGGKKIDEIKGEIQPGMTIAHALLVCNRILARDEGRFQASILTGGALFSLTDN